MSHLRLYRPGPLVALGLALLLSACGGAAPAVTPSPAPAQPTPAAEGLEFPDEAFRAELPKAGEPRPVSVPEPQVFELAHGLSVLLVERHDLPTVTMDLVLPGGSAEDPEGKEGASAVCMALLDEGTRRLDKIGFREALGDMASDVSSWSDHDRHGVSLSSLKRHLPATLDLWSETLLEPGLREADFRRIVAQSKAGLEQARGNAGVIAARVLPGVVYGPEHAYARIATEASYDALRLEDCKSLVRQRVVPAGGRLFVVGDITRAEVEELVGKRLARWKGKQPKAGAKVAAKPRDGGVFLVDVPGAQQAQVAVVHPGPPRLAPDHDATVLLASVLGDGFSSRINMNIREKNGWAYGASGRFSWRAQASAFAARASVRNDAAGPAIREILQEMKTIRGAQVTPEELDREKQGAILGLPARWTTGRSIIGTFKELSYFGLPLDYYAGQVARIQAVDAVAVLGAARKHLAPDEAQVVVVGDLSVVRPQIEALVAEGGPLQGRSLTELDFDGRAKAPASN